MSTKTFETKTLKDISSRIREIRGDLKQGELAEILGVSSVTISNYETGRRSPTRAILEKIARYGKTSIDWILTGRIPDEVWEEYYLMFKNHVEDAKAANVIPKAWISNDEMAIVVILREISRTDRIKIIDQILRYHEDDPLVPEGAGGKYKQLHEIIAEGDYSKGFDYEGMVEGFEMVLKKRKEGTDKGKKD